MKKKYTFNINCFNTELWDSGSKALIKKYNISGRAVRNYFSTLLTILFVFCSLGMTAATFYVSPGGSDITGDGSESKPWKTLARACNSATISGSLIHVNAGTYNEMVRANLAVGVSIEGEGIDVTIINYTYIASNSSDGVIRLNSGTSTMGNQSISNLTVSGSNHISTRGICINYRNNVIIHHCKIKDFYASAIFFRGSTKAWDIRPNPYCTGNGINNCIIDNSATRSSGESASVRINGQTNFELNNSTFTQTGRAIGQNGNILGGEWNTNLKIHHCTFTKPDDEGSAWNFFYELWHWTGGGEIYNNDFFGAATTDIVDVEKSTYDYGLKIYNNKFIVKNNIPIWTTHAIQGINLELRRYLQDIYVYDNYFKNHPNGIWIDVTINEGEGYSSCEIKNLYIYRNLFENIGITGNGGGYGIQINGYGTNSNMTFDNIQITNNTIATKVLPKPWDGVKWDIGGVTKNVIVRNNIIKGFSGRPFLMSVGIPGAKVDNFSLENNLYFDNGTNSSNFSGINVTNLVDQNNITGNPLFVSATDYNLQANSPAVDRGMDIGVTYLGNGPDIGAFESVYSADINTGIDIAENNKSIKIYPTPVDDRLIIEVEGNSGILGFEILRSTGQVVSKGTFMGKAVVQTNNFSPGIYLLKLENGKPFVFKKIVKI